MWLMKLSREIEVLQEHCLDRMQNEVDTGLFNSGDKAGQPIPPDYREACLILLRGRGERK